MLIYLWPLQVIASTVDHIHRSPDRPEQTTEQTMLKEQLLRRNPETPPNAGWKSPSLSALINTYNRCWNIHSQVRCLTLRSTRVQSSSLWRRTSKLIHVMLCLRCKEELSPILNAYFIFCWFAVEMLLSLEFNSTRWQLVLRYQKWSQVSSQNAQLPQKEINTSANRELVLNHFKLGQFAF